MEEDTRTGSIYAFINKMNFKVYIGQSWHPELRYQQHVGRKDKSGCPALGNALKHYGASNFYWVILHSGITDQTLLDSLETQEIIAHDSIAPNGYNLNYGGLGKRLSEVTKQKISIGNKGKVRSEEYRMKLSIAKLGQKWTPEQREKIIKARTGLKNSQETKDKRSRSRWLPVRCIELDRVFPSYKHAQDELGIRRGNIHQAIKSGGTCKGYHWERAGEYGR